ncbi:MAG TPA: glycosyltransferase family 4 protein [Candidatus Altiarchaeales archaeon]|nr:glycosyltransferase family 4 protein [Candidatus Altiarchaeales archaeon]
MKVLMLTSSYPRYSGDYAGNFVHELSKKLVEKDVEVTVLAPHDKDTKGFEVMEGVQVKRFQYFWPKKLQRLCYGGGMIENVRTSILAKIQIPAYFTMLSVRTLIESRKIDVIHAHWIIPQGLAAISGRIWGKRIITSAHGGDLSLASSWIGRIFLIFSVRGSGITTANSSFTKRILEEAVKKKVEVIPMGAGDMASKEEERNVKEEYNAKGKVIMYVGRLSKEKGVEYLIDAFQIISKRADNTYLMIVGEGPERESLEEYSQNLGISERVVFTGSVRHDFLRCFYESCDILVLPSVGLSKYRQEGLGVSLLEAMSYGIPVVASNVGGIADVVAEGETGLLVGEKNPKALADAIERLLDDEALRKRVSENGMRFVRENFGWESISDRFIKVYGEALE